MKRRLLLVDDHPLIRQGIVSLLSGSERFEVCAQAASRTEALAELERRMPDLAIVDISLDDTPQGGLQLVRDMKRLIDSIGILVFSMHEELIYAERALSAGASGYLMKKEPVQKIGEALEWISKGNIYVSHRVSQTILRACAGGGALKNTKDATKGLTDREFEVLQALSNGSAPQSLAKKLGISVKTLDVHKANIRRKLLLKTAAELNEYSINYFRPGRMQKNHVELTSNR